MRMSALARSTSSRASIVASTRTLSSIGRQGTLSAPGGRTMSETPTMNPAQRDGYRAMVEGPRGRLPGPYKIWVHNPKLLHAAAPLGQHFTPGESALSEREREIA